MNLCRLLRNGSSSAFHSVHELTIRNNRTGILLPSESIILASPILDRTAFLSKKRTLILTDFPRLICIKETLTKVTLKSEVFIATAAKGSSTQSLLKADTEGDKIFTVKTVCPFLLPPPTLPRERTDDAYASRSERTNTKNRPEQLEDGSRRFGRRIREG